MEIKINNSDNIIEIFENGKLERQFKYSSYKKQEIYDNKYNVIGNIIEVKAPLLKNEPFYVICTEKSIKIRKSLATALNIFSDKLTETKKKTFLKNF